MKSFSKLIIPFAITLALVGVSKVVQAEATPQIRNIVLVHGAFSDGSIWSEVIAILQRKGYKVTAVQNPLTSLAEDVAATQRVLDRQHGDVLLVGHSWAGAVVTEAGNSDRVKRLVYISAFAPDNNQSVAEMLTKFNAPMDGLKPDKNGAIWLNDPKTYQKVMASDLPIERVRILTATQQTISAGAFRDKISHAAWREKPSWYLLTEDDHAMQPRIQHLIATQIKAQITAIKSSHMSMLSHPHEVANLIDRAAGGR